MARDRHTRRYESSGKQRNCAVIRVLQIYKKDTICLPTKRTNRVDYAKPNNKQPCKSDSRKNPVRGGYLERECPVYLLPYHLQTENAKTATTRLWTTKLNIEAKRAEDEK